MKILVNSTQFGQLKTRRHTITPYNLAYGWEGGDRVATPSSGVQVVGK